MWVGGIYHGKQGYKDRLPGSCWRRGPKLVRNGRNYNQNHFFCLRFIFTIFQVPPEKATPTRSANSHPKCQFDVSPYYVNLLKNDSIPPPSPRGDATYEISLDMSMYIFNCKKTVKVIILKCL